MEPLNLKIPSSFREQTPEQLQETMKWVAEIASEQLTSKPTSFSDIWGEPNLETAYDSENVRRLMDAVREEILQIVKTEMIFEINDAVTQDNLQKQVDEYLERIKLRDMIYDYVVVCDDTNNTKEVVDNNQFVADIYVKPTKKINFIHLNFVATRTWAFEEIPRVALTPCEDCSDA